MICQWTCLQKGCRCDGCGYALARTYEVKPIRECKAPPTIYLTDTILRDGKESEVQMLRPACQQMGERTDQRVKQKCGESSAFLPVYQCSIHRLASPFGFCKDADLIKPCGDCTDYSPQQLDKTHQNTDN